MPGGPRRIGEIRRHRPVPRSAPSGGCGMARGSRFLRQTKDDDEVRTPPRRVDLAGDDLATARSDQDRRGQVVTLLQHLHEGLGVIEAPWSDEVRIVSRVEDRIVDPEQAAGRVVRGGDPAVPIQRQRREVRVRPPGPIIGRPSSISIDVPGGGLSGDLARSHDRAGKQSSQPSLECLRVGMRPIPARAGSHVRETLDHSSGWSGSSEARARTRRPEVSR